MGSQFWWFYDVIAGAAMLVCIFFAGKKGAFKALVTMMCYLVGLVLAFSISASAAGSIQKSLVRPSNVKNISKGLSEIEFNEKILDYLDKTYSTALDPKRVDETFYKGEDIEGKMYQYLNAYTSGKVDNRERFAAELRKGYAEIISGAIGKYLNKYAAETAAECIRDGTHGDVYQLVKLLQEPEDRTRAANFIADNYIAAPYREIIRLGGFLLLMVLVVLISFMVVRTFTRNYSDYVALGAHIGGGFAGIMIGAVVVIGIAAVVRMNVILGSNEMLFFNHNVINKTHLFKYAYDYVSKM